MKLIVSEISSTYFSTPNTIPDVELLRFAVPLIPPNAAARLLITVSLAVVAAAVIHPAAGYAEQARKTDRRILAMAPVT